MKVYVVNFYVFDFYQVLNDTYRIFKTREAAEAVMNKEFDDMYPEWTVDTREEDCIIASYEKEDMNLVFSIVEKEVEG